MSRSSFKDLISDSKITIPLIQRDYAQGRKSEELKANNFLEAILKSIHVGGLNLDFIYGSSIENKEDEIKKFIPLDGQQRLTTLFLIYFYISLKDKIHMDELTNFTYEVRSSSTDFIEALVAKKSELTLPNLRKNIEKSNWFFLSWNNDPTVKSILNMIDLIEGKFFDISFIDLEKITFDKLLLNEFNLTDELYVKMNSRGKPLNNFENFKSEYEVIIEQRFKNDKKKEFEVKMKLDNQWLDIFWKISQCDPVKTDKIYFNFFTNITLFFALDDIGALDEFDLFKFNYKDNDIDTIGVVLDALMLYEDKLIHDIREISIFENFLQPYIKGGRSGITYENRAIFYALMQFFIKIGSIEGNENIFKSWMRVNLNLINNIRFDSIEIFRTMLEQIDKLSEHIKNLYIEIYKLKLQNPSAQFLEEQLKAELIENNRSENWEQELIKAEKHWYLDGEIGFLLKFSDHDINKFIEYREKFISLFNKQKIDTDINYQTLIHRALLSLEKNEDDIGYLKLTRHDKSNRYTFCVYDDRLRIKNENWRRVFNSDYFKNLLDLIKDDLEKNLKDKINCYIFNCEDFKSYFVNPNQNWEVISYIRHYQIEWNNEEEIYLNKGGTSVDKWGWSRVAEIYSYYLYKKYFENKTIIGFNKPSYWDISNDNPSIVLDGYDNKYAIDIYYNNGFNIMFYNYQIEGDISNEILDILMKNNFVLVNERYHFIDINNCDIDNIFLIVEKLVKELPKY